MIIVCPTCQARYKFDESKLGAKQRARTRCSKCGGAIEIENPAFSSMTLPPGAAPVPSPGNETDPAPAVVPSALEKTSERRISVPAADQTDGTITGKDLHKMGLLELPKDKRYSLAIIQGAATGQIYQIVKTRTAIGRSGADVNLDDPEASRQHAVVEVFGDHAILRDLGSTNGTFVELERVDQKMLTNQMEFRIGSHVLMFIVTDVE
jgi:predicted Zn finger-like uncharacterized protein